MRRPLLIACALVLLLGTRAATNPFTITAARVDADARTGAVVAEGEVRASDGASVLTGERLVVDTRRGRGVLVQGQVRVQGNTVEAAHIELRLAGWRVRQLVAQGEASFETPHGVVFAQTMEMDLPTGRLVARGDVRVFVPPDLVAFGPRLFYDRTSGRMRLSGPVRVQSAQGRVVGRSLEASQEGWVRVEGEVSLEYADGSGRAQAVVWVTSEKKVVLDGEVFLQRGRQVLWADRVTIFYEARRVVAEGLRRLVLEEGTGGDDLGAPALRAGR